MTKDYGILGTPLIDVGCKFFAPGRYYDSLTITPTLTKLGNTSLSMTYAFEIGGRKVAEGTEVRGFVAVTDGRLTKTEIPEDIRSKLEALLA